MESIGEKLRATREEKSLSVEQVARDTNIAKRYILALEEENFSDFPGEPYLIGFLRNYSDYLGLDAEEIVGLYKNFKIQEQPLPMEELLEPTRPRRGPIIVLVAVIVAALIVAGVLFLPQLLSQRGAQVPAPTAKATSTGGTEYQLKDEIVERRFVAGDTVVVPVGNKSYKVKLSVSGHDLVLSDATGQQTVKLGEEKTIDLNGDGTPDLKVFLRDIDTQDPSKGIVVRFDRFTQSPSVPGGSQAATGGAAPKQQATSGAATTPQGGQGAAGAVASTAAASPQGARTAAPAAAPQPAPQAQPSPPQPQAQPQPQAAAQPQPQPQPQAVAEAQPPAQPQTQPQPAGQAFQPAQQPSQQAASTEAAVPTITPLSTSTSGPTVIMSDAATTPFSVHIDFTGNCLFRYLIDGQGEDQRYFQKGETTRLEAQQNVEIWASNGGAMSVTVAGNKVDMGNPGQVIARKIAWVQDQSSAGFQLEMTRMP